MNTLKENKELREWYVVEYDNLEEQNYNPSFDRFFRMPPDFQIGVILRWLREEKKTTINLFYDYECDGGLVFVFNALMPNNAFKVINVDFSTGFEECINEIMEVINK